MYSVKLQGPWQRELGNGNSAVLFFDSSCYVFGIYLSRIHPAVQPDYVLLPWAWIQGEFGFSFSLLGSLHFACSLDSPPGTNANFLQRLTELS